MTAALTRGNAHTEKTKPSRDTRRFGYLIGIGLAMPSVVDPLDPFG